MSGLETGRPHSRKRRMGSDVAGVVSVYTKLKSKGRTTNKRQLLESLLNSFVLKKRWTAFSQDMDYSVLASNAATKAVNGSTVRCYGYKLQFYTVYAKELNVNAETAFTDTFMRDGANDTLVMRHRVERRVLNTTNANLYVHVKMCTAKDDLGDNMQPDQLWARDMANDYGKEDTDDALLDMSEIENVGAWTVGAAGSRFSRSWSASPWVTYAVRPGKEMVFNVDSDICYSINELVQAIDPLLYTATETNEIMHFKKGQKVALVKIVGERVVNGTGLKAQSEGTLEGATGSGGLANTSYGALVEYLMTQTSVLDASLYPGFIKRLDNHHSSAIAAVGQLGYGTPLDASLYAGAGLIFNESQGGWINFTHSSNTAHGAEAVGAAAMMADEGMPVEAGVATGNAFMEAN